MSRYFKQNRIGMGGFGEVCRCVREGDGQAFAIKTLLDTAPDAVKRFQREARILSTLDHPRIIKILGIQLIPPEPCYIMPLYRTSLRNELSGLVGNIDRINVIFEALLEGMQYAHEQGVIHRDLKPENVLLNTDDDVVITDFGLGRTVTADSSRATMTGMQLGTFGYMAPEQLMDAKRTDVRADIFALGRMLYELYTGNPPGLTHDFGKTPPGVVLIIERCTKTRPEERFQTVTELRTAFDSLRRTNDANDSRSQLEDLLAQVVAIGGFQNGLANEFAELILRINDDEDLIREIVIKIPQQALQDLWGTNQMATMVLARRFASSVTSQGWGYSYTDVIGNAGKKFFDAVAHPEVRAVIVEALVEVGIDHNRWHVIGIATFLLEGAVSPEEGLAIANALAPKSTYVNEMKKHVNLAKVHDRNIRSLFID